MKFKEYRMRFGIFMGPYHRPELNPLISFQQDMEVIENLDKLGFDEAWIGEHHSGGIETIASPEIFIAAAAERTKRIKLGTGAITLPYHHPFQVADRIVQLDYQTRGRMMFGVAPGQIIQDATMMGLDPMNNRRHMQASLEAIIRLFKGETVTQKTEWFELKEARLQLLPYSDFDMATVGVISPSGPMTAGKFGMGLLSVAATNPVGVEKLLEHWNIVETEATKHGHVADRRDWRLMGPMHLADTVEQAKEDVKYGLSLLEDYREHINPGPGIDWYDIDKVVDLLNESGAAIIGTPEMARNQINRLIEKSGGFGTYLLMGVDWAPHAATLRSHQLFAQEVIPYFNGTGDAVRASYDAVMATGYEGSKVTAAAQASFTETYKKGS
ncbi:MAG: LLM class flavin-dependent oxidoreductase [Porticoccaceae bacterium]|nr:LLM class flavin-dependent oxidoreductase [Porticoccaceae bacterium]